MNRQEIGRTGVWGRGPRAAALYGNVRSGLGAYGPSILFSPGAAASDCLPGLTTDRIPGISSYKSSYTKEKTLNISAFSCPGQGLIYENIYKQLKFEYIYNMLKYSILKLYAMKCILSIFSCFAKMRTRCGHESIAVFEYKSYLCRV